MKLRPVNRYIQIDMSEPEVAERASGIVLPQDYAPTKERYASARVVACADDVRFGTECNTGTSIIVDRSMVEEIVVNNEKITVILDNYVIGII
jgi:co-chaperonin GroES (HSP10)